VSEYDNCQVGPHPFKLLAPTIRERFGRAPRRCEACMAPEALHPIDGCAPARPLKDRAAPIPVRRVGGRA
jgi:hypothetical protein